MDGGGGGEEDELCSQATAAVMRGRRRVSFFRPRTVSPCRPALPPSFPSSKNPPQSSLHGPDPLHGVAGRRGSRIEATTITISLFLDPSEYEILQQILLP